MSELVPYTEARRDEVERELAEIDNKKELIRRSSNGITVIAYWHKAEDVVSLYVHDAGTNGSTEFLVPNDEVMEWFTHPFANPDCIMPVYEQGEDDGA